MTLSDARDLENKIVARFRMLATESIGFIDKYHPGHDVELTVDDGDGFGVYRSVCRTCQVRSHTSLLSASGPIPKAERRDGYGTSDPGDDCLKVDGNVGVGDGQLIMTVASRPTGETPLARLDVIRDESRDEDEPGLRFYRDGNSRDRT